MEQGFTLVIVVSNRIYKLVMSSVIKKKKWRQNGQPRTRSPPLPSRFISPTNTLCAKESTPICPSFSLPCLNPSMP